MAHGEFLARSVRSYLVAIAVVLLGAAMAVPVCAQNTFSIEPDSGITGAGNTGNANTAFGFNAIAAGNSGNGNTAVGFEALINNTTGSANIAVGEGAGDALTTGDDNIDIGDEGVAGESDTIRIGTEGTQTATYIAGIFGTSLAPSTYRPVVVDSSGHLGTAPRNTSILGIGGPHGPSHHSSARYKRDIRDMGEASRGLMKLRPVSFRYKSDPGTPQYGLIAEEVKKVYPELVTYGDDGKLEGVRYELLPAMLLNELKKLAKENQRKEAQIAAQQRQIDALKKRDAQIDAMFQRINALEQQVRAAKPERLAAAAR